MPLIHFDCAHLSSANEKWGHPPFPRLTSCTSVHDERSHARGKSVVEFMQYRVAGWPWALFYDALTAFPVFWASEISFFPQNRRMEKGD